MMNVCVILWEINVWALFPPLDIWLQSFVYLSVVLALGYFAVSAGVLAGLYKTQVYVKVCVCFIYCQRL